MLHSNPFLGRIFVFELDPTFVYKYQTQVTFAPQTLIKMQIIDNTLVLHNVDEKSSQIYDFKIQDYGSPLIRQNLEVDTSFAKRGAHYSDLFLPEDQENESESAFKGLRGLTE